MRRVLALLAGEPFRSPEKPAQALRWTQEELMGPLTPEAVEGRYLGSYLGELAVAKTAEGLGVTVGPAGNRQTRFEILLEDGGLAIRSRMPISLRFQTAPDGAPTLFLGVHAYKRHP
jgi:hypothetical protein